VVSLGGKAPSEFRLAHELLHVDGGNMFNLTPQSFFRQYRDLDVAQARGLCRSRWRISANTTRSALLVSAVEEDREFLGRVFSQQGWLLYTTRVPETALAFLRDNPIPVVVTERNSPFGDWKDLLAAIQRLPHEPLLVVTARQADEYLWAEVLNLGGHDILNKPLQATEVLWVLDSAWLTAEDNSIQTPKPEGEAVFAGAH
jgi:DNA-binding NtrC family response regulator